MEVMIIISITSGFNGQIVSSTKSYASLSEEGVLYDKGGHLTKLNKEGFAQFSM